MSNLTDLLPAGAGGKQVSFVASGTLSSGQAVALNADGTVGVISETGGLGTESVYQAGTSEQGSVAYDSANNKVVVAYNFNSQGVAVVGSISGSSISWGTPVVFSGASYVQYLSTVYDSVNQKIVISYRNGANTYGTSIVGTVSGSSISFGTPVVFHSVPPIYIGSCFATSQSAIAIAYSNQNDGNKGYHVAGTVSGTSISFGTPSLFEGASTTLFHNLVYDPVSTNVVHIYQYSAATTYAWVWTLSGTTFSSGSYVSPGVTFERPAATYDSTAQVIVIAGRDAADNGIGWVAVPNGASITGGTTYLFNTGVTSSFSVVYNPQANHTVIVYEDEANSGYGTAITATVFSSTNLSFGSEFVFNSASTVNTSTAYDSSSAKVVITYRDGGNSNYGTGITYSPLTSNNTDFIGITDAAISDTASGSVTIKGGISTNVTGLTPNQNYYVQSDGTLSTTSSTVLAGKALSSTSINLDYTT